MLRVMDASNNKLNFLANLNIKIINLNLSRELKNYQY